MTSSCRVAVEREYEEASEEIGTKAGAQDAKNVLGFINAEAVAK